MRLALIHDGARLRRERAAITRLCVALLDEGVQLVRLVPTTVDPFDDDRGEQALALVPRIDYDEHVALWQRGARIATLLDELDDAPPDAIVALGDGGWPVALGLAHALDCPLVVEAWSLREAQRIAAMRRPDRQRISACVAGSAGIAASLRARIDAPPVHHLPVGVGMPPAGELVALAAELRRPPARPPRATPDDGVDDRAGRREAVAFAVIGDGDDVAAQVAALTAMRRLAVDLPDLRIAMEICGSRGHELWRALRKLDLLDRTSTIADGDPVRALLLGCDALVVPERTGQVRCLALEAMSAGTPVVALRDPAIEWLAGGGSDGGARSAAAGTVGAEPDRMAIIVDAPTADAWTPALRQALSPDSSALVPAAREHVRLHHRASDHAAGLAAICRQAIRGDVLPFAAA